MGKSEAAKTSFTKEASASNSTIATGALACAIASESIDAGLKMLNELQTETETKFVSPYTIATIHAGLGNTDEVFNWLNKAVDSKSVWLIHLHFSADPRFNPYKSDIRFSDLLNKIHLTDYKAQREP